MGVLHLTRKDLKNGLHELMVEEMVSAIYSINHSRDPSAERCKKLMIPLENLSSQQHIPKNNVNLADIKQCPHGLTPVGSRSATLQPESVSYNSKALC
jgi:hypothetical protein